MTAKSNETIEPLVRVENLVKHYSKKRLVGSGEDVRALDGVSFSIFRGTTLALVGSSGSGKSTLALCLACLERPTSGAVFLNGRDLAALPESALRAIRPRIQMVFQDPTLSLNPRLPVRELILEPLTVRKAHTRGERDAQVGKLMAQVGLSGDLAARK